MAKNRGFFTGESTVKGSGYQTKGGQIISKADFEAARRIARRAGQDPSRAIEIAKGEGKGFLARLFGG